MTPAPGRYLRMGNGELVQPLGCSTFSVIIGANCYIVIFTVLSSCVADVILGWDFLASADAVIDCGERQLHLNCSDIKDNPDSHPVLLRTTTDINLPPLTACAVTLASNTHFQDTYGLVEPLPTSFTQKGLLVPYSTVAVIGNRVNLYLTNASAIPIILPRGTAIAIIRTYQHEIYSTLLNDKFTVLC